MSKEELEKEVARLNGLLDALQRNNERNYKYFDEAQKRLRQFEDWFVNNHAIRAAESIGLCYVCANKVTDQPASTMQDNNTNVDNSYRAGILKAVELVRRCDLYDPSPAMLSDWLRAEFVKQGILKE